MFEDEFFDATLSSGDLPPVRTQEEMSGARAIGVLPKPLQRLVGQRIEIAVAHDSRRSACAAAVSELRAKNQIDSPEERNRFMRRHYPDVWQAYWDMAVLARMIDNTFVLWMPEARGYTHLFVGPDWKVYASGDDPLVSLSTFFLASELRLVKRHQGRVAAKPLARFFL